MRNLSLRQVAILLLASTTLIAPTALGDDYIVSSPTTITNGAASNVLDGNDSLVVQASGSITTPATDAISMSNSNNKVDIFGFLSVAGDMVRGMFGDNDGIINIFGSIITSGEFSSAITMNGGNNITNSGSIKTSGENSDGIWVNSNNVISNSGSITTLGKDSEAIFIRENNNVTNIGEISTTGQEANGIKAEMDKNNITNSGTIVTSGLGAFAISINNALTDTNTIINSGTLKTGGQGAFAITVDDNNKITNSGSIFTSGLAATAIEAGDNNIISNSGIISTTGISAPGILLVDNNNITNSGKLISAQLNSLIFTGTGNILNLAAPSFIGGVIDLNTDNQVNITTGRSQSVLWDFSTYTGVPGMSFVNGGVPYAWAGDKFATVDPTALSAAPEMIAGLVFGVSELVRNNSVGGEFWLKSFGSYSQTDANGIYNDYSGLNAGIVGGASAQINKDFYAGVTLGYGVSNLSVNSKWEISQTINSKGVLGGFYAKSQIDNFFADFALIGGLMANDNSRLVNDNLATMGIDYANATYNSWFISPELRIGAEINSGGDWTISPSAMVRYTNQAIDGYSETGSNANASIGARTAQLLEGSVELAASTALENGTLTLAGGLDYRQALGGATQDVTILGQNLAIPLNNSAQIIGYASANISYELENGASLDLNAKAAFGTGGHKSISGSVGLKGKF